MKVKRKFDLYLLSRHRLFLYGAATLLVIFSHTKTQFPVSGIWPAATVVHRHGMVGVEMFLLLSGFGLYGALSRD